MSKIFYIMGKSSSGKDTIYKKIREKLPQLKRITPYTTRPIREGDRWCGIFFCGRRKAERT